MMKSSAEPCFEDVEDEVKYKLIDRGDAKHGKYYDHGAFKNAEVENIVIQPGSSCWFESTHPFKIEGDDAIDIYYWHYLGHGAKIILDGGVNDKNCVYQETSSL